MINKEFQVELKKIMKAFWGSFINIDLELILIEQTNTFIRLDDVDSINHFKAKVLSVVSRNCYKAQPFQKKIENVLFQEKCLKALNKVLDTDFSEEDIEIIYQRIGNFINQDLAMKFIESGYDMSLLKE